MYRLAYPSTRVSFICLPSYHGSLSINHDSYGVWNSHGQHEHLLTYSFKPKSAFDAGSLKLMSC